MPPRTGRPTDNPKPYKITVRLDEESDSTLKTYCKQEGVERGEVTFEYERPPMKEGRFRTLCVLVSGGLYMGLTWIIVSSCGIVGLLPLAFVTLIAIGLDKM